MMLRWRGSTVEEWNGAIERAIIEAVEEEREACAAECEAMAEDAPRGSTLARAYRICAEAIRARSES
jgi:hypothetical protein